MSFYKPERATAPKTPEAHTTTNPPTPEAAFYIYKENVNASGVDMACISVIEGRASGCMFFLVYRNCYKPSTGSWLR